MKGWECPKCGNVYSPKVQECSACNSTKGTWTPNYPDVKPYTYTPVLPHEGPWWGINPPPGWPTQSPYGGYLVTCTN